MSRQLDDRILAYLCGELGAEEHAAVEAELRADPELAGEVELYRSIMSGAAELEEAPLPAGLDEAIWEAAAAEMAPPTDLEAAAPLPAAKPGWAASMWEHLAGAFQQPVWAGALALVLVGVVSVGLWETTLVDYETRTEMMEKTQAPAAAALPEAPAEKSVTLKTVALQPAAKEQAELEEARSSPDPSADKLAPLDPGVLGALSKGGDSAGQQVASGTTIQPSGSEAKGIGTEGEAAGPAGGAPARDETRAYREMAQVMKKKTAERRSRRRGAKKAKDKKPAKRAAKLLLGDMDGAATSDTLRGGGGLASAPSASPAPGAAGRSSSAATGETAHKIARVRAKSARSAAPKPKPSTRFAQPPPPAPAEEPAPEAEVAAAADEAEDSEADGRRRDEAKTERKQAPSWQEEVRALARKGRWADLYTLTGRLLAKTPALAGNPDFALYRAEAAVRTGRIAEAQQIAERWLKHPRYEARARSVLGKVQRAKAKKKAPAKKAPAEKAPAAPTQD